MIKFLNKAMIITLLFLIGCKPTQQIVTEAPVAPQPPAQVEEVTLEEMTVTAPKEYVLPRYNPSFTLTNDLLHTELDLKFNWAKQYVLGKATLNLKPYFYPVQVVVLDAKGFEIQKVELVKKGGNTALKYLYDNDLLTIQLDKTYQSNEEYQVYIEYVAKPNERKAGGSAAITQDKGLYFINPLNETPSKPMQIWTQGETESNSCWFPTVDKPNERCTQAIKLTVEDRFTTLSNGVLKSSTKNQDGTRTDYWVMDKPHAPYLVMLAIGEFAVVKDTWNGKDVTYYVEPKYEADARRIFPNTPEMLTFYSKKFGYEFPWQKYAQVVVRDYVSGAMENTTGVIFGEFMQAHERELIDELTNDKIVAHELTHHWFGDLVTCESWANLPLNESFANYGEYLWLEYKFGKEEADYHLMGELNGYMGQARRNTHNLIYFDYSDKEETFDGHSYNKGGCILHLLRNYLGDEAFFTSLKNYLNKNQYTAVESHDLRIAFEETTGKDLNWFFNQWFYDKGHPTLEVTQTYDAGTNKVALTIAQTQDPDQNPPIFQLPLAVDLYFDKQPVREKILLQKRKETFLFDAPAAPKLVNVDAEKVLVGLINHQKSEDELVYQYYYSDNFKSRFEAIAGLEKATSDPAKQMYAAALKDAHWFIRLRAVRKAENEAQRVAHLALNDPHSRVRAEAVKKLSELKYEESETIFKTVLDKDLAYPVIAAALAGLNKIQPAEAVAIAQKMEATESNTELLSAIATIYTENNLVGKLDFFEKNWDKFGGFQAGNFLKAYGSLLQKSDEAAMVAGLEKLKNVATDMSQSVWLRYACGRTINDLKKFFKEGAADQENPKPNFSQYEQKAAEYIKERIEKETNAQVLGVYKSW